MSDTTGGDRWVGLPGFDRATPDDAAALIAPCCASVRWIDELVARRPHGTLAGITDASDAAIADLSWSAIEQALGAHPRIGDRAKGADRESAWSRQEQSAAATPEASTQAALVAGNVEYERRFGHVFLICATGKSVEDVLAALTQRLGNSPEAEREIVRDELTQIVRLRLAKLFQ
ncbi:MAG: 2-oxo-4-hydroxy-4-carboxy-5-ureidoimidazoline decarboxylase [Pseudonocardiales bacterium]|jgi:2-oxo-4-hydroxy-4-carboxy-5-ureidoimidazoline decarboxylase|nr:2-oxo-4-hydroxy-4-carboxy-5-ureidoimidazoline decarboxylase [Pseudonocardiales bacterium]